VKRLLLENLATKLMALLLAVLTWIYLFTQGNGAEEIEVEFQPPALDRQVFASLVYKDSQGRPLEPGGPLQVRLSGPRGDVHSFKLRPSLTFACKFPVDPRVLSGPQGTVTINLEHAYFGLPSAIQIQPLPSGQITLEYVRYLQKEVDLDNPPWEGEPREGYRVESIGVLPTHIKAKVPADLLLKPDEKIPVRRIPVSGRFENFSLERWELEPGSRIIPETPFHVDVRIVAVPATRRLTLDLHLAVREESKNRVKLDTPGVTAELQGPKELIESASEAAFAAYVVVTDADLATPGPKNINLPSLGCHVLDPKFSGKVSVHLMPDVTPENRQVKITVLPK
jgi:hypothetical protein